MQATPKTPLMKKLSVIVLQALSQTSIVMTPQMKKKINIIFQDGEMTLKYPNKKRKRGVVCGV